MDDEYPPIYIREFPDVFDRFKFDYLFKRLLAGGYEHEEAKDIIFHNCALSLLVIHERIHNEYYLEISVDDEIAPDLMALKEEILTKMLFERITEIL